MLLSQGNAAETFVRLAKRWEDATAIVSPRLSLSYSELIVRAARSARELRALGIGPGSIVGLATRDGGEAIVLMLSLWMLGAVPVPIDFRATPTERALLAEEFNLIAILEDRMSEPIGYESILVDDSWTDIIAQHDGTALFENCQPARALISLTSGTTGRPAWNCLGPRAAPVSSRDQPTTGTETSRRTFAQSFPDVVIKPSQPFAKQIVRWRDRLLLPAPV